MPDQKGQTLIEVVTALGLIIITVSGLIGMGIVALKTSSAARNRTVAGKLAAEEMELVRAYRDSKGFSDLSNYTTPCGAGNYCNTDGSSIATGKQTLIRSQVEFRRWFNLETATANKLKITVTAEWTDSSGTHPISMVSYLANWL